MTEPSAGEAWEPEAVPSGEPAAAPELTPAAAPIEPYRRWASTLFTVLVLVGIVGTVAVLAAMPGQTEVFLLLGSVALVVATLLVVIAGIRRRASWALHAIAPVCYVIVAAAVIRVIVAVSQNTITIPLEGIGALMVLTRDHRAALLPPLADRDRPRVWLAVGAIVLAQFLPYATGPLASAGPFGAQAASLDLRVTMECPAGAPGDAIPVAAAWSWSGGEVLSPATDGVVVRWNMTTLGHADSSGSAFVDDVTMSHPAIWEGSGGPATALIQPIAESGPSREFGIDVELAGLIDGSVTFVLRPADPTAQHGNLEVWASYAHGDRWLKTSDASACAW